MSIRREAGRGNGRLTRRGRTSWPTWCVPMGTLWGAGCRTACQLAGSAYSPHDYRTAETPGQRSPFFGRCHGVNLAAVEVPVPGDGSDGKGGGGDGEGIVLPGGARSLGRARCRGSALHDPMRQPRGQLGKPCIGTSRAGPRGGMGGGGLGGQAAAYRSCLGDGTADGGGGACRAQGGASQHDVEEPARGGEGRRTGERGAGGNGAAAWVIVVVSRRPRAASSLGLAVCALAHPKPGGADWPAAAGFPDASPRWHAFPQPRLETMEVEGR